MLDSFASIMIYDYYITHILIAIAFTSTLLSTAAGKPGNYERKLIEKKNIN